MSQKRVVTENQDLGDIKTYTLGRMLNVEFLQKYNYQIEIIEGGRAFRAFHVAKILKKQVPTFIKKDLAAFLQGVMHNIDKRTIYRWIESGFKFDKMYAQSYRIFQTKLPKSAEEQFLIRVLTRTKTPKVVGEGLASINSLEEIIFERIEEPVNKGLNLSRILERREEMIENPAPFLKLDDEEVQEKLILRLCESFATGLITITEACDKHGLPYLQFLDIISRSDAMRSVYEQAVRIANSIQNSKQLTLVDQKLIQMLALGKHSTETISYDKHIIPGQLEPRWIEKRKVVKIRDLTASELLLTKALLLKSTILSPINGTGGTDFSNMTESELMDYIMQNYQELQREASSISEDGNSDTSLEIKSKLGYNTEDED